MNSWERFLESITEEIGHAPTLVWQICHDCHGDGGSSAYLGSYSQEDMAEMDDEWIDDYMAGRFDRTCEQCHGSGKVKRLAEDSPHHAAWVEWCQDEADDRAVRRAESGYCAW